MSKGNLAPPKGHRRFGIARTGNGISHMVEIWESAEHPGYYDIAHGRFEHRLDDGSVEYFSRPMKELGLRAVLDDWCPGFEFTWTDLPAAGGGSVFPVASFRQQDKERRMRKSNRRRTAA
jgi:hypothetical protein